MLFNCKQPRNEAVMFLIPSLRLCFAAASLLLVIYSIEFRDVAAALLKVRAESVALQVILVEIVEREREREREREE